MDEINEYIQKKLFSLRDEGYKSFHSKLMPGYPEDKIIGVRTPALKSLAAELCSDSRIDGFLDALPHKYYEQYNLHAYIIMRIKLFRECISRTEQLLPYIDNWATCDCLSPAVFKKHRSELLPYIEKWLHSERIYTVRFAVGLLMRHFLDDAFDEKYLSDAASVCCEEYYINMMVSWYFATALAKQYDASIVFLKERRLPEWVHNKTIQKSIESFRISDEKKAYLKTLRIK